MEKKYELTDEFLLFRGIKLFRIRSLKRFDNVEKGDFGGYVESEINLSQEGNCWVYDNAKIFHNARVYENAKAFCNAEVYENARIFGHAEIHEKATITNDAMVYGNAEVHDKAQVVGSARICGNTCMRGFSKVSGNVFINGEVNMKDDSAIHGNISIDSNNEIYLIDNAVIKDNLNITNTFLYMSGYSKICGCGKLQNADLSLRDHSILSLNPDMSTNDLSNERIINITLPDGISINFYKINNNNIYVFSQNVSYHTLDIETFKSEVIDIDYKYRDRCLASIDFAKAIFKEDK